MKINYKEKALLSPEDNAQKEVEFMVEDQKLQFQSDLLATKRDLATAKAKVEDLKTDYPLDLGAIIEAQLEVEALEDGLSRMEKLQEEFGF